MRNDIVEILCDINPLLDPDDEDMSIAEFLESKQRSFHRRTCCNRL